MCSNSCWNDGYECKCMFYKQKCRENSVSKAEQASEATTEAAKDDTTADYVASGVELQIILKI